MRGSRFEPECTIADTPVRLRTNGSWRNDFGSGIISNARTGFGMVNVSISKLRSAPFLFPGSFLEGVEYRAHFGFGSEEARRAELPLEPARGPHSILLPFCRVRSGNTILC